MLEQILISNLNALHEGMRSLERGRFEMEICRLKNEVHREKSRADYFEQLYIREKRLNEQSRSRA